MVADCKPASNSDQSGLGARDRTLMMRLQYRKHRRDADSGAVRLSETTRH